MRKLYVQKIFQIQECNGEDLIKFKDETDKNYLWYTKSITSKISMIDNNEWITIYATIKGYNSDNIPILKNVRLAKFN